MSCGTCGASAIPSGMYFNPSFSEESRPSVPAPNSCGLDKVALQTWKNALKCVKTAQKLDLIGITDFECNVFAGLIQSALNYPDNYCYFSIQLEPFQTNILPRIVTNVSECID